MTQLFAVEGAGALPAQRQSLTQLGLQERAHLQEWVISHPEVLGEDIAIITAEYDRWAGSDGIRTRDRLDVLGLEASGRLVVAELKREDSGSDVHLQAITYAALVSRFTPETLAEAHAAFLRSRGEVVTEEEALARLLDHCDGEIDADLLRHPRIVLVAGTFPRQVTHTAVWLSERGLDIDLVQVSAWIVGDQVLAGFTKLYPTPEVEEFTLAPLRSEAEQSTRKAAEKTRAAGAVRRIIAAGILPDGTPLRLDARSHIDEDTREAIATWVEENPSRGQAVWRNHPRRPVMWAVDGVGRRPTTLAKDIVEEVAGVRPSAIRGTAWWITPDGLSLAELADTTPSMRR